MPAYNSNLVQTFKSILITYHNNNNIIHVSLSYFRSLCQSWTLHLYSVMGSHQGSVYGRFLCDIYIYIYILMTLSQQSKSLLF